MRDTRNYSYSQSTVFSSKVAAADQGSPCERARGNPSSRRACVRPTPDFAGASGASPGCARTARAHVGPGPHLQHETSVAWQSTGVQPHFTIGPGRPPGPEAHCSPQCGRTAGPPPLGGGERVAARSGVARGACWAAALGRVDFARAD